jgi:hypothetical protein
LKFPERGCARSASRSTLDALRLVFDTAALRQMRTMPAVGHYFYRSALQPVSILGCETKLSDSM